MRKWLRISLILMLATMMLAGCAGPAASSPDSAASSPSATPVATTSPDPTQPASAGDEGLNEITLDEWTYYLDENDPVVVNYGEDAPLHRKKTDGSQDEDLGLRGFEFDIIGDYLYVDSNYPDLDQNGKQAWFTTRMGLDGSDSKRLEYGSMSVRLIPEGEQKFYFTTMDDSAIFVSDFSCEDVVPLLITLPDEGELAQKLGADRNLQLDIGDVADGWITFDATFSTSVGIEMYNGAYKMTEDGADIEKISGTYFDYESLESELD